jgi:N-acetylglucosamine-6-phosphate deacetylase
MDFALTKPVLTGEHVCMSSISENADVTLAGRLFPDGSPVRIDVADGRIRAVQPLSSLDEPGGVQRWLAPGFYDLQVNGFAGIDLGDPNVGVAGVRQVCEAVLRTGCTRFLPTIITGSLDSMCERLGAIAEAMESDLLVSAMCPGMHVEGPFIHPEDGPRGAHPCEHVRPPNLADCERL